MRLIHLVQCCGERLWWVGVLTPVSLVVGFIWAVGQMMFGELSELTVRDWVVAFILVPNTIVYCIVLIGGRFRRAFGYKSRACSENTFQTGWSYVFHSTQSFVWLCNLIGPIWVVVIGYYVASFFGGH